MRKIIELCIVLFSIECLASGIKLQENGLEIIVLREPTTPFEYFNKENINTAIHAIGSVVKPEPNEPGCEGATNSLFMENPDTRRAIINHCLTNDKSSLSSTIVNMLTAIVYLYDSGGGYCTGTLIDKDKILTAQHCNSSEAFFFNGEKRVLNNNDIVNCDVISHPGCDWKIFKISPVSIKPSVFKMQNAKVNTALWIPGFAISDLSEKGIPKKYILESVKWPRPYKNNCKAFISDEKCLVYFCPLLSGYSGAPIIDLEESKRQGIIIINGIHTSGSPAGSACPFSKNSKATVNSGNPSSFIYY
jgi:V8-like Glu-specific endopeptidase